MGSLLSTSFGNVNEEVARWGLSAITLVSCRSRFLLRTVDKGKAIENSACPQKKTSYMATEDKFELKKPKMEFAKLTRSPAHCCFQTVCRQRWVILSRRDVINGCVHLLQLSTRGIICVVRQLRQINRLLQQGHRSVITNKRT